MSEENNENSSENTNESTSIYSTSKKPGRFVGKSVDYDKDEK